MRIFVTGATGVVGRRVVPALRTRGHQITAAGRSAIGLQAYAKNVVNIVALDAEASAMNFTEQGRAGVALRFAYFYGPRDAFTRQLGSFVRNGWLPLLGRRDAYFPMVFHDDAAAAVVAALDLPSGIYNVVDDQPMTHAAIGATLASILSVRPPRLLPPWTTKLGGSLGETLARSLRLSNAKLRGASSWRPSAPNAADGLRRVLLESSKG